MALHLFHFGFAEQAGRPEDQHKHQDTKGRNVLVFNGEIVSVNPVNGPEILEIVCQGFGANLTLPLGVDSPIDMSGMTDKTWRSMETYDGIIGNILNECISPNLGGYSFVKVYSTPHLQVTHHSPIDL